MEEEFTVAFLIAEGSDTLEDDIYQYTMALTEAGFSMYEEEAGYVSEGIMFIKEAEVNGESCILIVELVDYFNAFAIAVYTKTE